MQVVTIQQNINYHRSIHAGLCTSFILHYLSVTSNNLFDCAGPPTQ